MNEIKTTGARKIQMSSVGRYVGNDGKQYAVHYPGEECFVLGQLPANLKSDLAEFNKKVPADLKPYIKSGQSGWVPTPLQHFSVLPRFKSMVYHILQDGTVTKEIHPHGGIFVREKASKAAIKMLRELKKTIPEQLKDFVTISCFRWEKYMKK